MPCSDEAGCPKFVTPAEPDLPPEFLPWLRRIFRLDSLRASGCRFQMNELDPETWTSLIALTGEKQRIERLVFEAKDRVRLASMPQKEKPETTAALKEVRKQTKAPPPH